MRNSAIILAALLTAMSTLAAAEARSEEQPPVETEVPQSKKQWVPLKQCLKVNIEPGMAFPTYVKYADTVHCFLRIDGNIIINRMCHPTHMRKSSPSTRRRAPHAHVDSTANQIGNKYPRV
jgi:hypothetical protein